MNKEKINLQQSRDFGETFNASVKLVRQNFKIFLLSLLFIAGPFVLLSALAGAFYQSQALTIYSPSAIGSLTNPMDILKQFGLPYLVFLGATVIANLTMIGTVFSFIINYQEKGPDNFTINDVGRKLVENIGNIILIFIIEFFAAIFIIAAIAGIIIAIGMAVPALGIVLGLLTGLGLLLIGPPIFWQLSVVNLIKMKEKDKTIFQSFGQSAKVMKGNFWWTWVIVVCGSIAIGIMGFVFALPQAGYQMVIMFSHLGGNGSDEVSIPFIIVATICTFCATLVQSLMHILMGVHYYSLNEQKNGEGLMQRINEIGNTPDKNVEQHY